MMKTTPPFGMDSMIQLVMKVKICFNVIKPTVHCFHRNVCLVDLVETQFTLNIWKAKTWKGQHLKVQKNCNFGKVRKCGIFHMNRCHYKDYSEIWVTQSNVIPAEKKETWFLLSLSTTSYPMNMTVVFCTLRIVFYLANIKIKARAIYSLYLLRTAPSCLKCPYWRLLALLKDCSYSFITQLFLEPLIPISCLNQSNV